MHKVGWHLNNVARPKSGAWSVMTAVPPVAVLNIPGGAAPEDIERILKINPDCHVFIRPYYKPEDDEDSKELYIQNVESMIFGGYWQDVIPEGQRHLQLFNEPNMPRWSQYEGFGPNPEDIERFNHWFVEGYNRIKAIDPTWKIGFTPLTPGNKDAYFHTDEIGAHYYMHGPEAAKDNPTQEEIVASVKGGLCYEALSLADEYYAHIYCLAPWDGQIGALWGGLRFIQYARFFPKDMDVWITECGISAGDNFSQPHWAVDWYTILQAYPKVRGTCWWRLDQEVQGVNPQVEALKQYINNLPPDPPQMIPWPEVPIAPEPEPEPPEPEPEPPSDVVEFVRGDAWELLGHRYNSIAHFPKYARTHGLGRPLSDELDRQYGDLKIRIQLFEWGIVFAEVDKWEETTHIQW